MTPEEQQVNTAQIIYLEQQMVNLAHEGSVKAAQAEFLAMQLKAAQEKIAALTPKPESNVVQITEPAA